MREGLRRSSVTVLPSNRVILRPLSCANNSSGDRAIMSISRPSNASFSLNALASVTAFSANSTFRPRLLVKLRRYAVASLRIFRLSVSSICAGAPLRMEISSGEAAPVSVPGAITAMSEESKIKKPAEAARDPDGAT